MAKPVYCSRNILLYSICAEHRAGIQSGLDVQRSALCWFVTLLPGSDYYSLIWDVCSYCNVIFINKYKINSKEQTWKQFLGVFIATKWRNYTHGCLSDPVQMRKSMNSLVEMHLICVEGNIYCCVTSLHQPLQLSLRFTHKHARFFSAPFACSASFSVTYLPLNGC